MKAGKIAELAGVTDGNWAPTIAHTMQSRKNSDIHILGDGAQGDMPKSGFSANSQAKCAQWLSEVNLQIQSISSQILKYLLVPFDTNDGIKVGASYEATDEKIAKVSGFVSKTGEDASVRKATYGESLGWYAGITSDMFG